ncbi:uncharacterized protein PITG_10806 [Phytophthora infestans T30-4]|uniref:Uncharacterized protein n=1 Tax=Phytophthora infestans (strain T30-4) TaxID=403677 RepID=D0NH48_PHYIT|nr:uncharacterized protein PITG_10806 [Phytophthora infestans T30-4]EEY58687.1 conserved hypothetical protein [Phytophthora infestans T30-4]|eukprot:XP_002901631.1 conserved hypothetical protein [Phytophthora infestans T30-4]
MAAKMERPKSRTDQALTMARDELTNIRSDCERDLFFVAAFSERQQLFLSSASHRARVRIDVQGLHSEPPPHGERWGARLARLGLLLVHCLLRPFLATSAASAVDTRPMRTLELQSTTADNTQSPTKSLVAGVLQRLSMDLPAATSVNSDSASPTNSSSEPSPQAAVAKPKTAPSPPSSPTMMRKTQELVPEQELLQQQEDAEQQQDELEELKQTLLRKSTGSIAIMTRQQEAFDHRRHTFSTMSADGRANMRRRSYDFTSQFGGTFPPSSPPPPLQPLPPALKAHHHLQLLRVYGKSTGPAKSICECHEEGASMVALVTPNPDTVWTRGKPVNIEWKVLDFKVDKLCIELLEDGLSATTLIAKAAPNTGFFTYHKVPWGMESGSKYFLRISAADDPERYRTSSFFQISSAP